MTRWFTLVAAVALLAGGVAPAAAAADEIGARAYLAGRDPGGLAALASAVSDPHSPAYRHFLTAAQFWGTFGPAQQQTAAVEDALRAKGLTVTGATGHFVSFTATKSEIDAMQQQRPQGVLAVVPTTGPLVDGGKVPADAGAACAHYEGESTVKGLPPIDGRTEFPASACGYLPAQFRSAYGVTASGLTGKGATVGIVGLGQVPSIAASVDGFAKFAGDKPLADGQLAERLPVGATSGCRQTSWAAEEELDLNAAHGMAPDANLVYSAAACLTDERNQVEMRMNLLDGLDRLVDDRATDVVSGSWSFPETTVPPAEVAAWEQTFQQAAVEGVGLYFSSGDGGDESAAGHAQTEFPASDPWVTGVGGTSLRVDHDGHYLSETGWGTVLTDSSADGKSWTTSTFNSGAGGGTSERFGQPSYQDGVVPGALASAHGKPMRVVPDIAADADFFDGLSAGDDPLPGGLTNGGTSLSSPLIAGLQADAQQAVSGPLGFANPLLYAHHEAGWFHDVTDHPLGPVPVRHVIADVDSSGNAVPGTATLVTDGQDGNLKATPGYDDVTGLGSPAEGYLAALLNKM